MKLRIQNNARGERGVYVNDELVFVGPGATQTFEDASKGDVQQAAKNKEFRVQSSEDGGTWEEHSNLELPEAKPFIAVAKGARGESVRYIDLEPGEWFVGYALASEKPDGPAGYEWVKVGGTQTAAPVADYRKPVETIKVGTTEPATGFDPEAVIASNAPDVIASLEGMNADQLAAVKAAEIDREKPRKGVMEAIEEKLKEVSGDPFAEPAA